MTRKSKAEETAKISTSRRSVIKGFGSGALVTAVASVLPGCSNAAGAPDWSATFDWIAVGSGGAGLSAAIRGHDLGMKTLLLEHAKQIGGIATFVPGSPGFLPLNPFQKAKGYTDSRESGMKYMLHVGGGYAKQEYVEAYVDNAGRVVEYLNTKAGIPYYYPGDPEFPRIEYGFYNEDVPGGEAKGRSVKNKPFPSEALGAWRDKVWEGAYYTGFHKALGKPGGGEAFRTAEKQLAAWKNVLGPEKFEAVVKQNQATRTDNRGWIAYLFRAILDRGIDVRLETEVERLITENGRVIGVVVNQNGKRENLKANKGVVLALGNKFLGFQCDWGEGWRLAAEVGGKIGSIANQMVAQCLVAIPEEIWPNGKHVGRGERSTPHSLIVNWHGERFDDEPYYVGIGRVVNHFDDRPYHRFHNFPNYLIFDQQLLEKYSFGGMPPGHTEARDWEWLTQGSTLGELAQKLKIQAKPLEATVARFNEFARRGKDADFNREPRTLGTVEKPPFYGLQTITPDPFETTTEVVIDTHAQVLHYKTDQPIPGLYCCGRQASMSRVWGVGYQGGFLNGAKQIFGFLAAEHAAATTGS